MQYCSIYYWKKFMYKWTQAVQICVVQGQTVIYFIYPFTDGHLGCFYLWHLWIRLEHGCTSIWVPDFMFFLGICPEAKLLDHVKLPCNIKLLCLFIYLFMFRRTCHTFFHSGIWVIFNNIKTALYIYLWTFMWSISVE